MNINLKSINKCKIRKLQHLIKKIINSKFFYCFLVFYKLKLDNKLKIFLLDLLSLFKKFK